MASPFVLVARPRWIRHVLVVLLLASGLSLATGQAGAQGIATTDDQPGASARQAARYSIALIVENAGFLTAQERSLTAMLEGDGHTVTAFSASARPRVNARNNPTIDLLLFSPSLVYTDTYHLAQRHSLPMLDMSKYSWYRRYVLPWSDDIAGPRFSGITATTRRVRYHNPRVIDWDGRRAGRVRVIRQPHFSGGGAMRRAINHSTGGDARFFLRNVTDRGRESALGVYLPAGSTITKPSATTAGERRRRSKAPWLGLILFNDDFGDGNQYAQLSPAGRGLFEAAMARLMNP